jgi:regulatory protein
VVDRIGDEVIVVITAITEQLKNPERVNIFIDGKYSFSLTLDEILAEKIKRGLVIDESRLKNLKKLSDEGKLRAKALNWVMLRPHSERELRDYLFRKKAEKEFAEVLVEEFEIKKYISDHDFAIWWADQRKSSGRSNRFIRSELVKKGVAREIIDEVMSETANDEEERLKELVAKKAKLSRYQDKTKLMQYLVRQGFGYDDIKRVISEL